MNAGPDSACYLYGFTRCDRLGNPAAFGPPQIPGASPSAPESLSLTAAGIDPQHPPFYWADGDLAAILSLVSPAEFCGPAADAQLQDLAWVGPRVCRHQAVLEAAMPFGPILPARFGTLFSSLTAVGQFLERHRERIGGFLERVAGQQEWALKGLLDRARAEEELGRRIVVEDGASPASSPGLVFLQEQRLRLKARQALEPWLAQECNTLLQALTPLASETCPRQVLSREATGEDHEMVLNWAFLVPQSAVADFQAQVERANARRTPSGLTFAVSGPWPPFSFCPALEAEPV